jgi:LmbE family N-acetylglucosaminyl deacetylase
MNAPGDRTVERVTKMFKLDTAQLFVPAGLPPEKALARTTHMAIGAHQDDLEIMAFDGILKCFQRQDRWFTGVVVTNGSGSPRDDVYRDYTDEAMREVRIKEQKKAAVLGEYAAQALLDYPARRRPDPGRWGLRGSLYRALCPRGSQSDPECLG